MRDADAKGLTRSNNPGTYHSVVRRWPAIFPSESCLLPTPSKASLDLSSSAALSRLHPLVFAAVSHHHLKTTFPIVSRLMEFKPPEYWVNVSPTPASSHSVVPSAAEASTGHTLHDHCGATYSGVLYLDDGGLPPSSRDELGVVGEEELPPNGLLILRAGVAPAPPGAGGREEGGGLFSCDYVPLRAVTGACYLFSGSLPHAVSHFRGVEGRRRISLSFNFFVGTGNRYS